MNKKILLVLAACINLLPVSADAISETFRLPFTSVRRTSQVKRG